MAAVNDDAVVLHHTILEAFMSALRPRWIQVNGLAQFEALKDALHVIDTQELGSAQVGWVRFGREADGLKVPVLAHKFSGWLGSAEFATIATDFRMFLDHAPMFEFE